MCESKGGRNEREFQDFILILLFWENKLQQEAHYSFIPL